MIFNFTLGAYYPTAYYIALQIKGPKTGVAASVTGFTQTVSAGSISYFAASMTENGIGFSRMLGMSAFTLAVLSIIVIIILKVTQWKTGKSAKINRSLKYQTRVFSENINELVVVNRDGKEIILDDGRKMIEFVSCSYLGLETHPLLSEAIIEAVDRFGAQISVARNAC
ncbi:transporter, major facilitator family protein [Klebsiella pneumoniae subsp. ozaenae]|uniref:Transporter, major facilitator family protein n=1 Tax=Klebsiella pneumoniae subsp. ozaenae TaxID=574 RepID=A0A378UCI9_KLEPO|nr:transporter, major facilitator family protein [Klebsiella pneumoniae subsp. ozaenae]